MMTKRKVRQEHFTCHREDERLTHSFLKYRPQRFHAARIRPLSSQRQSYCTVCLAHAYLFLAADSETRKATEVTRWPLSIHDPLSKWSRGKILLIGDAAHPVRIPPFRLSGPADAIKMLPFGGQGSNQAIEDAGALGYLLNNIDTRDSMTKRIDMFDTVRRKRASRVQILSKVRVGKEQDIREELMQYADPPGSGKSSLV